MNWGRCAGVIRCRLSGRTLGLVLAVGLSQPSLAQPQATPAAWQAACHGVGIAPLGSMLERLTLAADPDVLVLEAPERALVRGCLRASRQPQDATAQAELAEALTHNNKADAAQQVLKAVQSTSGLSSLERARLQVAWAVHAWRQRRFADLAQHTEQALQLLAPDVAADRRQRRAVTGLSPTVKLRVDALVMRSAAHIAAAKEQDLTLAQEALDLAAVSLQRVGHERSFGMSNVHNQRAMLANARGDYAQTEAWARAELLLLRDLLGPDTPAQLDALATLGVMVASQRRFTEGMQFLLEGRRIGTLHPGANRRAYLGILGNLAGVLIDLGLVDQALSVAEESVTLAGSVYGPGHSGVLASLNRRVHVYEALQRYDLARLDNAAIVGAIERDGGQMQLISRLRLLDAAAAFHIRVNEHDEAQRLLGKVLANPQPTQIPSFWRGRFLARQARLHTAREQWADADAAWHEAMPLLVPTVGEDHPTLTVMRARRCEAQWRAGLQADACQQVRRGLQRLQLESGGGERAVAQVALAYDARMRAQPEAELLHALAAVAAAQGDGAVAQLWRALDAVAVNLRASGKPVQAVAFGKAAVVQLEAARRDLAGSAELRTSWLKDKHSVYRRVADWLAEDGRIDEALAVHRMLKLDEYREFVRGHDEPERGAGSGNLLAWTATEARWWKASPLSAHWGDASPLRVTAPALPTSKVNPFAMDPGLPQRLVAQEAQRLRAWVRAMQSGFDWSSGRRTGKTTPPPAVAPAPGQLDATLFIGPGHLNIVLDSQWQGQPQRRVLRRQLDPGALSRDIGTLLSRLEQRGEVGALLKDLHAQVLEPVAQEAERVGARLLRLRLDGDLRYLPVAALHDGQQHVAERYAVLVQAATQGDLNGQREPALERPWVQAFGTTRAAPGLPALGGVLRELCAIVDGPLAGIDEAACASVGRKRSIAGQGWLDASFTRERLREGFDGGRSGRLDLLHIGTHFVLQPGAIHKSWMLLGNGTRLPVQELVRWPLRSQDVVTLSACQTAVGGGAEVEGLAGLLLRRGAGHVVASLWQVGDDSTAALMQGFYAALAAGEPPALALQGAQRERIAMAARSSGASGRDPHPADWAGFVLSTSDTSRP